MRKLRVSPGANQYNQKISADLGFWAHFCLTPKSRFTPWQHMACFLERFVFGLAVFHSGMVCSVCGSQAYGEGPFPTYAETWSHRTYPHPFNKHPNSLCTRSPAQRGVPSNAEDMFSAWFFSWLIDGCHVLSFLIWTCRKFLLASELGPCLFQIQ